MAYHSDDIKKLLAKAQKACYNANDALVAISQVMDDVNYSPIAMSNGPFSGISQILGYIKQLQTDIDWLRCKNRILQSVPNIKKIPLRKELKVKRLRRRR